MRPAVNLCWVVLWGLLPLAPEPARGQEGESSSRHESRTEVRGPRGPFKMTPAVACRSIHGIEDYEVLPGAALTSDEKLLVYYRPMNYTMTHESGEYHVHFTQDGQIRRSGQKAVLRRKKNLLDSEMKRSEPLGPVFLRNSVALKGLLPGKYEYDIILRDENNPGAVATQTLKFRIIPPILPTARSPAK